MDRHKPAAPAPRAIPNTDLPSNIDLVTPRPDIYPSAQSRPVSLVGGLAPGCVNTFEIDGRAVDFSPAFRAFPRPVEGPEALALGAQLGDLIGHLIHRNGRFNVLIPRSLMGPVRSAATLVARTFLIWECGVNEDPDGKWARAEFGPIAGPIGADRVTVDRIVAERVLDWKTVQLA